MISALYYLQYHLTRNRLAARFKRLRQPKYLAGAIVGGLYFYFYFFQYLFAGARRPTFGAPLPADLAMYQSLGALLLLVIVVLAWIIPHERAALIFSEAEIAFLFPAPVSRRGLIHFKLVRSQVRIFFTVLFLTLISNRFGRSGTAWTHAAGWWLAFSTLNLHFLGSSFARTMLLDRGISNWLRRTVILGAVAAFAVVVALWANRTLPPLDLSQVRGFEDIRGYVQNVLASGPMPYLLLPFQLVVAPYFATDAASFLRALVPALLILGLHYWWVVRSDVAFEEASVDASQKVAAKIAAIRAGNWRTAGQKIKKRRAPFKLKPTGFPALAIFWKNLISVGQMFSLRLWIFVGVFTAVILSSATSGMSSGDAIAMLCGTFLGMSLIIGPQLLRQDLRQDLVHADVLKGYPLRGWQLVLGEMLTPMVILTGIQWLLLIFIGNTLMHLPRLPSGLAVSLTFSAAILLPVLNAVMLLIPNAGVLLFPAWFQTGKEGPQGIEATGQRLIMMLGQLVVVVVTLIPAAGVFLMVFFIGKIFIGPQAIILPASFLAALTLAGEVWFGVVLLGRVFERFDLSAELTN